MLEKLYKLRAKVYENALRHCEDQIFLRVDPHTWDEMREEMARNVNFPVDHLRAPGSRVLGMIVKLVAIPNWETGAVLYEEETPPEKEKFKREFCIEVLNRDTARWEYIE